MRPRADARGRTRRGILGVIFGGLAGIMVVLTSDMVGRLRETGDPAVEAFFGVLGEVRAEFMRFIPGLNLGRSKRP